MIFETYLLHLCVYCVFHRVLRVRCTLFPIRNFLGNIKVLRWAMSEIYSLSWESCLAYVAFIEGNFPQCGPQYIAVFGGTIPLLVQIMWALPMHYPGHFPRCTQEIIMDIFIENPLLIAYLFPCYLPNLYPCILPTLSLLPY